jgi:hypothetical protein
MHVLSCADTGQRSSGVEIVVVAARPSTRLLRAMKRETWIVCSRKRVDAVHARKNGRMSALHCNLIADDQDARLIRSVRRAIGQSQVLMSCMCDAACISARLAKSPKIKITRQVCWEETPQVLASRAVSRRTRSPSPRLNTSEATAHQKESRNVHSYTPPTGLHGGHHLRAGRGEGGGSGDT